MSIKLNEPILIALKGAEIMFCNRLNRSRQAYLLVSKITEKNRAKNERQFLIKCTVLYADGEIFRKAEAIVTVLKLKDRWQFHPGKGLNRSHLGKPKDTYHYSWSPERPKLLQVAPETNLFVRPRVTHVGL